MHPRERMAKRRSYRLISKAGELALGGMRDAVREIDNVAGRRKSRRGDCLGHGHVEIQNVEGHLDHAHRNLGCARRSDHQYRLVAFEGNGWADRGEPRLAGRQRSGAAGPGVKHPHAAIVHEPKTFGDHAWRHTERMSHRDAVSLRIADRHLRRVLARQESAASNPAWVRPAYSHCDSGPASSPMRVTGKPNPLKNVTRT
jgi:hypothetical protein